MAVTEPPQLPVDGSSKRSADLGVSHAFYQFARGVVRAIDRLYWRVEVDGIENMPATGRVILAPLHRSNIDSLVVAEVTRRKLLFMAKDSLWKFRPLGAVIGGLGGFPVHRGATDRLALDRAQSVLERDEVLVLFPEGGRRAGNTVEDLHEGAAFLSARTGAPIVPVGIGGSEAVMPYGSRLIRPGKVCVTVGSPLLPPERSALGRVPRNQVHGLTEQLGTELQRLADLARERAAAR
jgi:1-acyl-sn-glycerol-3-phosphate acyltransferase